ncbi:MAG: glycine cleavage system aminomethyltransferase GcvT [Gemmatimonadetes bacterium]|nr:glycine cleavage system aminomethyltransferase GcvT [Gemmatimonadota bacterium]
MSESTLLRTPLHGEHAALKAKLVPFAGYEMPVQYPSGITAEHRAVREAAGLFDVSHMGEFEVRGDSALDFIQYVTTNDVSRLAVGQAQYSTLLGHEGTMLDDLLVYRFADWYMLVVNASNREKDFAWIDQFADRFGVQLRDVSDRFSLLALQGPRSEEILRRLTRVDLDAIRYYHFAEGLVDERRAIISRTGYTGEDGFELYLQNEDAAPIWRRLLDVGGADGLIPAGLGARDSLRLEMGYALYGNDLDDTRTPLEAGLGWIVKIDKGDFVGREALVAQREKGITEKLAGFRLLERGFPRHGYPIQVHGQSAGEVASGVLSPTLGLGVGMAYLPVDSAKPGSRIEVVIRGQPVPAEVVRPPFYTLGTVRS